jgi:hypothetical protein
MLPGASCGDYLFLCLARFTAPVVMFSLYSASYNYKQYWAVMLQAVMRKIIYSLFLARLIAPVVMFSLHS